MRLLRVRVRNYRVHRELVVDLANGVTAITAPNEYGKSTLLEAVHRALFLKHRTGGEIRRAMGSRHGGHPEVEVHFEADGSRWRLRKLFAGQTGACELADETRGQSWKSDEAEAQLAKLVGREPVGSNKKELDAAWDHLWVWQGEAGGDPLRTAGAAELMRVLDGSGGEAEAEALLTGDATVIDRLRERVDATWTKSRDTTKKDSDVGKAVGEIEALRRELEAVRARRQEKAGRIDQLAEARRAHAIAARAKAELAPQLAECLARHGELDGLRVQVELEEKDRTQRANELLRLDALAKDLAAARERLEPAEVARQKAKRDSDAARLEVTSARSVRDGADARAKADDLAAARARDAAAAARTAREAAERRTQQTQLEQQKVEFDAAQRAFDAATKALADALAIGDAELQGLLAREKALQSVVDRLEGAAVRLARTEGASALTVDGRPLAKGDSVRVNEVAELRTADGSVVEVRPGGGELAALRDEKAKCESALRDDLLRLGVADVAAARTAVIERARLQHVREQLHSALRSRKDPSAELQKLPGAIERLERELVDFAARGIAVDATADVDALQREVERQERERAQRREFVETAGKAVRAAEEAHQRLVDRLLHAEKDAAKVSTEVETFAKQVGDEVAFEAHRSALRAQLDDDAAKAKAAREQLTQLTQVADRLAQLRRHEQKLGEDMAGHEARASLLAGQLQGDHHEDLDAAIDQLEVALAHAERRLASARARADGEKMLLDLLEGMQREQRARREAPFVAACERYLAIAHGPGIRAHLDGEEARGLGRIDRTSVGLGAFAFGELSQGGQELTAICVRLAMAEVLAKEQPDRTLPLVLDDAVTNVDPDRLRAVGFLLAAAAQNGVQVVFATCDVERAPGLRADAFVSLPKPQWGSSVPEGVEGD